MTHRLRRFYLYRRGCNWSISLLVKGKSTFLFINNMNARKSLNIMYKSSEATKKRNLAPCKKNFYLCLHFFYCSSQSPSQKLIIAESLPIKNCGEYRSDKFIDFESKIFYNITSPNIKKIIFIVRKTQNVTTCCHKIK